MLLMNSFFTIQSLYAQEINVKYIFTDSENKNFDFLKNTFKDEAVCLKYLENLNYQFYNHISISYNYHV